MIPPRLFHLGYLVRISITLVLGLSACSLGDLAQSNSSGFGTTSCAPTGEDVEVIYVSNLGWHTGVVLPSAAARAELRPALDELDRSPWVEFGWGDRDYYTSSNNSLWDGIRALFFSSGSAVHVVGLSTPPKQFYKEMQLCEVTIAKSKFGALMSFVHDHFAIDQAGDFVRLGDALYETGSFYDGRGAFSLSYTCNSWTAEALQIAGCDIKPGIIRASSVFNALCPQANRRAIE